MPYNSDIHHRRSIRLQKYDYSRAGAYFVTICTYNKESLLGNILGDKMRLNDARQVVVEEWIKTTEIRHKIQLDKWVVMPNHFHAILIITGRGTACRAQDARKLQSGARRAHEKNDLQSGTVRRAPTIR